nr:PREDICTED: uncharacterized protein LOC105677189 [Linepithema humile]
MAFTDETSISLPSLNLNKINIHTKLQTSNSTPVIAKSKFCKSCCKPCRCICPRAVARYKAQLKTQERSDNFVLISARYIVELYHWTNKCLSADDFLRSIVASAILFAIGVKLSEELNGWNLSRTVS